MPHGKFLALDGVSIIRRLYEASPETPSAEKAANTVQAAATVFRRLLAVHAPAYGLVAFDAGGHTWRHDIRPTYIAHGASMPPELQERLPQLQAMLADQGLRALCIPGVEAGDVIATAVARWLQATETGAGDAIVAGSARNLQLLVSAGAQLWEPFRNEWRDRAWIEQRYGVAPEMLGDLFALVGDPAHDIPGIPRVGIKTAARLLQSYKTLEGIMAGAGILKNATGEQLRKEGESAFLSRRLLALKTDVHLGVTWKALAMGA